MSFTVTPPRRRRLQRSELAVPATSEQFFAKAAKSVADVVFLDLEDAVAPAMKTLARKNAVAALNDLDWGTKTLAVRVNSLDTEWALRDIIEVVSHCPRLDLILLPKVGTAFDVQFVDKLIGGLEREQPREKTIGIEVLIESTLGLANVESIAASSERLEAMIFGVGDYSLDLQSLDLVFGTPNPAYSVLTAADAQGQRVRHWNDQWHFALARIANACRAHGLRAIDGPFTDYADADGYRASASRAAALGFEGKWAIHPSQIALANEIFTPSEAQISWARRISGLIADAGKAGKGAIGVDGVLVDFAHQKLAARILQRADAAFEFDGRQA